MNLVNRFLLPSEKPVTLPSILSLILCGPNAEELAAYRKANPQGKITLSPLYVEQIVLMLILGLYAVLGTFWILHLGRCEDMV